MNIPEDPYAFARVSVMKSKLLKKEDYDKILKMQPNEIAKFLAEKGYDEINKLSGNLSGHELVEAAVAKNTEATQNKLKRIANPELSSVMQVYLNRNDLWNLKNIFRAVIRKDRNGVEQIFSPIGRLSKEELEALLKKENPQDVLKQIKPLFGEYKGKIELSEIEEWLTRRYYEDAMKAAKELPNEGEAFRQFILSEVKVLNLITIFKMKAAEMKPEEIEKKLFMGRSMPTLFRQLINSQSLSDMFTIMEKSEFKEAIDNEKAHWEKTGSLIHFESGLYRKLLKENLFLLHKFPLSIDVILGYMFAKGIEAKNLRLITKGRALGLSNEFIESELVI